MSKISTKIKQSKKTLIELSKIEKLNQNKQKSLSSKKKTLMSKTSKKMARRNEEFIKTLSST